MEFYCVLGADSLILLILKQDVIQDQITSFCFQVRNKMQVFPY